MNKWFFLSAILFLPAIGLAQTPTTAQSTGGSPAMPAYGESHEGLSSQVDAILQSYRAGDEAAGGRLINQFRIPDTAGWLSEHLGPEQSAKLTERYDRLFANFSESLEKTMEEVAASHGAKLVMNLKDGVGEKPSNYRPGLKPSGVVAVNEARLYWCEFTIATKDKSSISWIDACVYEGGAFRFAGFNGWPFWAWEEGSEGSAPKGGNFFQPAILISDIPPAYPADARSRGIEGVVVVQILIDKQGRVKRENVVQGDPLLTQVALDAVRRWRYKPAMIGGAPAEQEVTAKVVFRLH